MRLAHAISEGTYVLAEAGVFSAGADARALAAHVCGAPLYAAPSDLDDTQVAEYFALIGRRAERVPLQHLTGQMGFRHLTLEARPGVFVTRPETEWLCDPARTHLEQLRAEGERPLVVDWCCGSGAIGLALAQEVAGIEVLAVEVDPPACALATANARRLRAQLRSPWRLVEGDATSPDVLCDHEGEVALIVTNPPYVVAGTITQPEALRDPALALYGGGADGLNIPRALLARATTLLRAGGRILMEHGDDQGEAARAAASALGFAATTGRDATGRERWLDARLVRD